MKSGLTADVIVRIRLTQRRHPPPGVVRVAFNAANTARSAGPFPGILLSAARHGV